MNKKIRVISMLLIVMMCMFTFVFTCFAAEDPPLDPPPAPPSSETPSSETPSYEEPSSEVPSSDDPSIDPSSEEPTATPSSEEVSTEPQYTPPEFSNADSDGFENDNQITNEVTDKVEMYETKKSDAALKESKWSNISLDTSKAPKKGEIQDFKSIKENNSKEDNGGYILYIGYILIALAVIGIIYYIIATVTYRKKLNKLRAREASGRTYGDNSYGEQSSYSSGSRKRQRRYGTTPYSSRKRDISDTAELPKRNYKARH